MLIMAKVANKILLDGLPSYYNYLFFWQRSLQEKVLHNETPEAGNLFLNLTIRRAHIIEDSINEVRLTKLIFFDVIMTFVLKLYSLS